MEAHGEELLGYLCRVLHSEDTGREVFAALCEAIVSGIARYRGEASLRAYVYGVAWNLIRRHRRRASTRRKRETQVDTMSPFSAPPEHTRTPLWQRTSARDRLSLARAQLSDEELTLLVLRVDRRMSWDEVASIIEVPAPTVRKRYERLVKQLRAQLVPDTGATDDE